MSFEDTETNGNQAVKEQFAANLPACYFLGIEFRWKRPVAHFKYINKDSPFHNYDVYLTDISQETEPSTKDNPKWTKPKIPFIDNTKKTEPQSELSEKDVNSLFTMSTTPYGCLSNSKWRTLDIKLVNLKTFHKIPLTEEIKEVLAFRS